jgi:S-formylglutathione hydrolase FrmB
MLTKKPTTQGQLELIEVYSKALENNLLGDSPVRHCPVYLPPEYDPEKSYPLIIELAAFGNSGLGRIGWQGFRESIPERLDRLIAEGMPPVIVAFPDCFTSLGGNQYINSVAFGNYEDFLKEDLLSALEANFPCGGPGRRGLIGKSSGGYGALVNGMHHSTIWSAIVCHSGDMGFEWVYLPEMPKSLMTLENYDGSPEKFLRRIQTSSKLKSDDFTTLMILAMAASYDPNPNEYCGIQLPVTHKTAELIPERWQNWLQWDPLEMIPRYHANLKSLKFIFIDCGIYDQHYLHFGARRLNRVLNEYQIPHVFEEFPDNHSSLDYRLDRSLPLMAQALSV